MGFTEEEVFSSPGLLRARDIQLANGNTTAGLKFFSEKVASWRYDSIQRSQYHPDAFVFYQGRPVIIDAKFRLPDSVEQVADSSGIKDIQAYMNDFGLNTAVMVVPKILNQAVVGSGGYASIEGGGNRINVVEMQDSDDPLTQRNLKNAIEDAARTSFPAGGPLSV